MTNVNKTRLQALLSISLLSLLAACGGGGDASPAGSTPPATGSTTTGTTTGTTTTTTTPPSAISAIEAQVTVTPPAYSDPMRAEAFNELNRLRALAGVGLLRQSQQLDLAAQSHAQYHLLHGFTGHDETPGAEGFTGVTSAERIAATGYQISAGAEITVQVYDNTANGPRASSIRAVNALTDAIYHRLAALSPDLTEVGVGVTQSPATFGGSVVIEIENSKAQAAGQKLPEASRPLVVWPAPGATEMSRINGNESPNPVPGTSASSLGLPASVHCLRSSKLVVTSFTMTVKATGQIVNTVQRNMNNDPAGLFGQCEAAIVPTFALEGLTEYAVSFRGTVDGVAVSRDWTFKTKEGFSFF